MKHIKLFENFKDIDQICEDYGIENYRINKDGTVDVDSDVNLSHKELMELPLKFGKVTGNFNCNDNLLTTLEGHIILPILNKLILISFLISYLVILKHH